MFTEMLEFAYKIYDYIRNREYTQLHCERYWESDIFEKIKKSKKSATLYVMTPANYEFFRYSSGIELSKDKLSKIMSERIKELAKLGFRIQLHIHFWQKQDMPIYQKERMLKEALFFMNKCGIRTTELVAGWFRNDKNLKILCQKYNLKLMKKEAYKHDYNL